MTKKDLVAAATKKGLDHTHAERAVDAVLGALRDAPTGVLVFRETEGRSVPADKRRTIFMCG
ncbi:hypothetical protein [Sphingomonas kyeonggiensis]|uniref:Uncharacterized protein n=1 Tax=Sphingomonas kyeonggiensis TaxID=1268553 RepID=A0A7W6NZ43_9SPHN|nr:hypothetical protein [Sphingomonas kyeonggiensis]MBB4100431.1 hypothetical protein [Sphingomonas kyeonggiensis]